MELKDIVSIGGKPGLYAIVGQRKNGLIVESIDKAKKRIPTNLTQKVSVLSDISIYTLEGEEKLSNVLKSILEGSKKDLTIPSKSGSKEELSDFLKAVLPNYDEDRVYPSDIKKLIQWYGILDENCDLAELTVEKEEDASSSKTIADSKSSKKTNTTSKAPKTKAPNTKGSGAKKSTVIKASGRGK